MTLGRCPFSIYCSRGTPSLSHTVLPTAYLGELPARFREEAGQVLGLLGEGVRRCAAGRLAPPAQGLGFKNNPFTDMCCGTEAGSDLRLIDSCITQLKAQGPSRTCNESKEEVKKLGAWRLLLRVEG